MRSHRKMPKRTRGIEQEPVSTPIVQSTTFTFPNTKSLIEFQKGKREGFIYTRYSNPTIEAVENRIADLENAERSLLFASGMAAISSVALSSLKSGDEVLSSYPVYGGTAHLFEDLFKTLKIKVKYFPAENLKNLDKKINSKTKLIYLESPTNPNLQIIDLKAVVAIARKRKIKTVVDSTFATPVLQQPINMGIDLVIHSVTKFMGGHSDIIGGVVSGSWKNLEKVYEYRKLLGGCMDPHPAFLLEKGLKTLEVRMDRHCENAANIALFLETDRRVKNVIFPGLASHPQHQIAKTQMNGFGGMVTFDLGNKIKAEIFADSLKLVKNAVSLGGTESLVSLPIWTSHYGLKDGDLRKAGVTPGMVRLSVGLEKIDDLIKDISRALKKIK